ncbi:BMP family protein [uncultured Oscillibacter sp.]|jgi:basic membrane protein A|uniref:BMP family lipoprotein n=1 Tax=uncultured Oscillibacter sp. TaxID=876091 RepID=UPI0025F56A4C|nr:BMP family ABC transporter substrate-binding protein [uncultured Oscillibacter sp.]
MKRKWNMLLALALAAVMTVSMAGCGGAPSGGDKDSSGASGTPDASGGEDGGQKIVYLVNGNLGDKGFYDSAASGIQMMADNLGAETKIIEMGRDETSYESNFLDVSEQDWDLIVCGTFSVSELAQEVAPQYPDKNYLIFDVTVDFDKVTTGNMIGVSYYSNQGAFLSGVLAAKMLLQSGDARIDSSKKMLGFVGSMDTSGINDFLVGYLEGVKYVDPEIQVLTSYVGSFEDVTKCMEMTTQLYNQGAQIVYAPASQSILGAATAAANSDKYLIACDQDLYAQLAESDPNLAATILSTSLKNVGDSLFTAVQGLADGTMTYGNNYTLGLDSGAVGLAKNENYTSIVPAEIQGEIDEVEAKIVSGEIEVASAFNMSTEEVVALRDSMK